MPIRKELATITDLEAGARVIPMGSDLYRQGDICSTYYIVLNGWIALSVLLDDGLLPDLGFRDSGRGTRVSVWTGRSDVSLRPLPVSVRVNAFPRSKLDAIIESNPRLAVLLCRQITADEVRAHDHLANRGLRGARERISRLLLEIYVRVRRRLPAEPGEIMHVPLSQGHIGQALGLTYVHACRTLQMLREQKIVRFANHRLEIINPPALVAVAGIEVDALVREHRDRLREFARAHSRSDRNTTDPLPMGWMPTQNNTPSRMPFVSQAKAACARPHEDF